MNLFFSSYYFNKKYFNILFLLCTIQILIDRRQLFNYIDELNHDKQTCIRILLKSSELPIKHCRKEIKKLYVLHSDNLLTYFVVVDYILDFFFQLSLFKHQYTCQIKNVTFFRCFFFPPRISLCRPINNLLRMTLLSVYVNIFLIKNETQEY